MKRSPRTPLRRVSKKRQKQNREYAKLRKQFLEEHPFCTVCQDQMKNYIVHPKVMPVQPSTEIHHCKGREGKWLLDTNFFLAVCATHHRLLHDNPKWSVENGYTVPRR